MLRAATTLRRLKSRFPRIPEALFWRTVVRHGRTDGAYNVGARLDAGASLSGYQRNRFFLNVEGSRLYRRVGFVGGGFTCGWSRLSPPWTLTAMGALTWLSSMLTSRSVSCLPTAARRGHILALRFVGGNDRDEISREWSVRDGYGVQVEVDVGGRTLLREHRAGEGFSAQNSATLIVGLGAHQRVDAVRVRWPSGRTQSATDVAGRFAGDCVRKPSALAYGGRRLWWCRTAVRCEGERGIAR